jgi:hypothetical protein
VLRERQRRRANAADDEHPPLLPREVARAGGRLHAAGVAAAFGRTARPATASTSSANYATYLLDPDGNNGEALYRDVGCAGHGVGDW